MKKMWCRVGVELTLTDEQYNTFLYTYEKSPQLAHEMLKKFLCDCAKLSGDTYFPYHDEICRPHNTHDEMEFNFN